MCILYMYIYINKVVSLPTGANVRIINKATVGGGGKKIKKKN
jgi:hypothetical protein